LTAARTDCQSTDQEKERMARATITYVHNPTTGKREWQIEYESEPDATAHEHERGHRRLVRALVGDISAGDEIDVDRGESEAPNAERRTAQAEAPARRTTQRKPS
jgi:hypothetical protein